jgi:enoyl-[acyl-carrier-protein] reductase (NADH)
MAIADVSSKSLPELISLKGRVAVVTGGSRGLGFAICKRLTQAGAAVFVAARNQEAAKAAAEEIQKLGGNAIAVSADATDSKALGALADQAISEFGRLDIWVNNAGVSKFQPLWEVTDDQWHNTIDANLSSAFYGSREAAKRMRDAGNGGVIINPTFRTLNCHIHPDLTVKKPQTHVLLWFEVICSRRRSKNASRAVAGVLDKLSLATASV